MTREIRLEDLLGRRVLDGSGRSVGRLEEVVAEWRGDQVVVAQYVLGMRGLLRRLSGGIWRRHAGRVGPGYTARWDQIDVSDPQSPRLACRVDELERLPAWND